MRELTVLQKEWLHEKFDKRVNVQRDLDAARQQQDRGEESEMIKAKRHVADAQLPIANRNIRELR